MTSISTFELNQLTVNSALNVQTQLGQSEIPESSGLVAQDFGTMGGNNSTETLSLESEIARAQTWSANATSVGDTTQAMYSAIGTMGTLVTDLQSKIAGALASPNPQAIVSQASTLMTTLAGEMNTQVAGQYVFSGGNSSVPAVNLATYPSYYQGDTNPPSVRVSQQQSIQYGVLGSNPAFKEALGAMQAVINAFSAGTIASPSVTGTTVETSATTPLGLTGTFAINGGSLVNVNSSDSLTQIAANINAAAGTTGITASVSGTSLSIASATASALTFTGQSGSALSSLGITPTTSAATVAQYTPILDQALSAAQQATQDLSNLQQTVATSSSQLQALGQQQSTFVTYLENSLSDVKDVNTGQVASQVSQYQTQLQASYMAVASVTKLSLAQFL